MKSHLRKIFFWDEPALRLATLFIWWGAFYTSWMKFMLWTSMEQLQSAFTHYDNICPGAIIVLILTVGVLSLTHLHGLVFRPFRILRITLWLLSFLVLGIWAALPLVDEKVIEIIPGLALIGGRFGLLLAFCAQVVADAIHLFCKWRQSRKDEQNTLKRRIALGLSFVIFPMTAVMLPIVLCPFYKRACQQYGEELRKLRDYPSQAASKAICDDWEAFKKIEQELETAWKAGEYMDAFARWEGLRDETSGKWWLEQSRLQLLPRLLRKGIPDDALLCQRIQAALLTVEPAMKPLKRESVLLASDARRQAFIESGPFDEDVYLNFPIIRTHFQHHKKPLSEVPVGLERLWHYLLLKRIDEFYELKLKSLDTPQMEMGALEAQFDHWLNSVPWNYDVYAPNLKCMDGVGVHINRYADLYGMQDWQACCREAYLGIALHQYRLQHGKWPATLELLEPTFLPRLPRDPFTNASLKTAPHPELPDTITVYSERKTGTDTSPDELLRSGFPVAVTNQHTNASGTK
jgi:hypothetical protein